MKSSSAAHADISEVTLTGLKARPELNGTRASILGPIDAKTGRYPVCLADGEKILIKPANFTAAHEPAPPALAAPNAGAVPQTVDKLMRMVGLPPPDPKKTPLPPKPKPAPTPPPAAPPPASEAAALQTVQGSGGYEEAAWLPASPMWTPPVIGEASNALAWRRRGEDAHGGAEDDEDEWDEEAEEAEAVDELAVDAALLAAARRGQTASKRSFEPIVAAVWHDGDSALDSVTSAHAAAATQPMHRWDDALVGGHVRVCDVTTAKGVSEAQEAIARRIPIVMRGGGGGRRGGSGSGSGSAAAELLGAELAAELSNLEGLRSHLGGREVTVLQSPPDAASRFTYYFDEKAYVIASDCC